MRGGVVQIQPCIVMQAALISRKRCAGGTFQLRA